MATALHAPPGGPPAGGSWYGLSADEVATRLEVDGFRRLLGTTPLTSAQFLLALAAAVLLFVLWEIGKLVARHRTPR